MSDCNLTKLYIKKLHFPEAVVLFMVLLPFAFGFLFDFLGLPDIFKYLLDVMWIILFATLFLKKYIHLHKEIIPLFVTVILFFLYTFVLYLLNYQSIFYYVWGLRNNFRFYIYFFAVCLLFSEDDANAVYKMFDILFWINAIVTFIQYFALGYNQDRLGGIFGVQVGVNGYTIIFFVIVLSRSLLSYMSKVESTFSCFSKCIVALVISAIAELKVFYIIFLIILGLSALLTEFTWRKFLVLAIGAVCAILGSILLSMLFDFENSLSLKYIWELATQEHYTTKGTVNRLSAIPVLARTVLKEFSERLFGLGLGNCDTSSLEIFNTPFFNSHSGLRYHWFSCAVMFLETGYMGILIYIAFFVICCLILRKKLIEHIGNRLFSQMAIIMVVICMILFFYNGSLRTESAYMIYFVLAIPFINVDREISADEARINSEITYS